MEPEAFVALSQEERISLLLTSLEQGQNDMLKLFCEHYASNDRDQLAEHLSQEKPREPGSKPNAERLLMLAGSADPVLFVKCFKLCSRVDGLELTCYETGLVNLVSFLNQHPNNTELVVQAFHALSFLAVDAQVRENFSPDGVVGLSVKLLHRYRDEPSVCLHILNALTNIFFRSIRNKLNFATEGGLEVLQSMLKPTVPEQMALALARIFHNLSNTKIEYRAQMVAFGVIKRLLDLGTAFIQNVPIIENIVWALLNLTLNSRDIKGDLNHCGGIPILFEFLKAHSTNPQITYHIYALFNQISTRTTTRVAVAVQNAVVLLLDSLWSWESEPSIQLMALKVLDILCTLSSCRKRLTEGDRLPKLITWLCDRIDNRPTIEAGLGICQKLAISSGDSRRALQDSGGNTFFVNINTKYSNDQELTCQCVQSSSSLMEKADYENESSDEEVLSSDAEDESSGDYDY